MKRQILLFAAALFALCVALTLLRLWLGIDYDQLTRAVNLPIVWVITVEEALLGLGGCAIAWLIGRAYNGGPQARHTFPNLARALAFSFLAYGVSSLGDAVCHWLGAYWSLVLVKAVSLGTISLAARAWRKGWPELWQWHAYLLRAEHGGQ